MLKRRHILPVSAAAAAVLTLGSIGAAVASNGDPSVDVGACEFQSFCLGASTPGSNGSSGKQPAGGSSESGSGKPPECTVKKMEPQPPSGSRYWQGKDPKTTTLYVRSCRHFTQGGASAWFDEPVWAPNGTDPVVVDPAVLAQQAVDKMLLAGPKIGMAPGPGKTGLVGMPVWMWAGTGPTTFGPNTASASAGGVTVTATAKVSQVSWSMGDGTTVTCAGPGSEYRSEYGKKPSPTCGHMYTRTSRGEEDGRFEVTATSTWVIDWEATGAPGGGQLIETRTSQAHVAIGELQAVGR
jgi:hypothetical protein